jgi:hypothetical protein
VAAKQIMQLVSPYTAALEEHAPQVAEGLDKAVLYKTAIS